LKSKTKTKPIYETEIKGAASELSNAYNANKDQTQALAGDISGLTQGLIDKYNAGSPTLDAANTYATDVLSGKYLTGNPQLQNIIDQTGRSVTNQVQGAVGTRGRVGGDVQTSLLGRELSDAENNLRYNDYNTQMGRMDTMAGLSPSLNEAQYSGVNTILNSANSAAQLPYAASGNYASSMGSLLGQYTNTTQKQGMGGLLAGVAGSALSGWAGGGFKGL